MTDKNAGLLPCPAEQIKNWLRVQANSEKDEKLKAIFVECHNAAHKIICEYNTRPAPPAEAVTDDAREALEKLDIDELSEMLSDAYSNGEGENRPTARYLFEALQEGGFLQSPSKAVDAEVLEKVKAAMIDASKAMIAAEKLIADAGLHDDWHQNDVPHRAFHDLLFKRIRLNEALALISSKDGQDGEGKI